MTREESSRIDNLATMVGGCQEGIKPARPSAPADPDNDGKPKVTT